MPDLLLRTAVAAHVAAGITALLVLWLPLFARKGSTLHIRAGRVYAWAMGVVAITGAGVALARFFGPDDARRLSAAFLFYVALLAWDNAWMGVRALRTKRRTTPNTRALDLLPPVALLLGALGMVVTGAITRTPLPVVFGLLGGALALGHVRFWLRAPAKGESLRVHVGGMGASCIATITAFLVVNARHLGLGAFTLAVWILPGIVGAIAIAVAQRRLRGPARE